MADVNDMFDDITKEQSYYKPGEKKESPVAESKTQVTSENPDPIAVDDTQIVSNS